MFQYQIKKIQVGPFSTSKMELKDITKAWIAISLAFAFILPSIISERLNVQLNIFSYILISALTVGTAFLVHEIAHKLVAQHYGCFAEFRSFDMMLILAVLFAYFFQFIFVAPGAVMISGPIGKRRNGKISASGPFMNIILALLFLAGYFSSPNIIFYFGYTINSWLALFNMLPFWLFDGKKIYSWNKFIYFIMLIVSFGLVFAK